MNMFKAWLVIALVLTSQMIYGDPFDKTVFLTILARNKAHLLPYYFEMIENIDYDKQLITVYINTNNNSDNTKEMLQDWIQSHKDQYNAIVFASKDVKLDETKPHEWTIERLKHLAKIRNKSLKMAKEYNVDYYLVIDCDNFIAPYTLKELIKKDKPIIAPMLRSFPEPNDIASNFFCAVTSNGYYQSHPDYLKILERKKVGTFKVPVVHCTYLIKAEYLDKLSYTDGTNDYEFIIFSRTARNNNIDQYICNEKVFGTNLNFWTKVTLEEEAAIIKTLPRAYFMLPPN